MIRTQDNISQLKVADSATASEDRVNYRTNNTTLQTLTVNGKSELTSAPSPYGSMSHDDNGNLILSHNEGRFYEYDDENQLVAVQRTAGLHSYKTTFAYDGKLRLRLLREYRWEASGGEEESLIQENGAGPLADPPGEGSWVLLSETRYVYDGMLVIQERDGNNTPTVTYTRGSDLSGSREGAGGIGGLLARTHGYSSGNWSTHNFYHADGNGNITYLVDNSQAQAASYRYDPFGNTISSSGSLAAANTYRFSSKMIHANTGLYYYGYRWYASEVQRWLNRDPIGELGFRRLATATARRATDELNLYLFVGNNPLNKFDALGLQPMWLYIACKCGNSAQYGDRAAANAAQTAGWQAADAAYPDRNSPEHRAMRHCVTSAVLAGSRAAKQPHALELHAKIGKTHTQDSPREQATGERTTIVSGERVLDAKGLVRITAGRLRTNARRLTRTATPSPSAASKRLMKGVQTPDRDAFGQSSPL